MEFRFMQGLGASHPLPLIADTIPTFIELPCSWKFEANTPQGLS